MIFQFKRPHEPLALHEELTTAIPALRPRRRQGENRSTFRAWSDGETFFLEPEDDVTVTEQEIQAVVDAHNPTTAKRQTAMRNLRRERTRRVGLTDWTQLADVPQTTRDLWTPYRQQLRDLPTTTTDPANPVWPTPPAPVEPAQPV